MKIDQRRLKRQQEVIDKWTKAGRRGTLEAVTGFGKTFVALLILQEMNDRLPSGKALIIVPTQNLKQQWEKQIEDLSIQGASVMVINTAVRHNHVCDLLILDEIHNYTSEVFSSIFGITEYRHILGLTATLNPEDDRYYIIEKAAPVFDTVSLTEAVKHGYVSQFQIFNLGLRMSEKEEQEYKSITDAYYKHFAIFNNRFHVAMGCLKDPVYRSVFARNLAGWDEQEVLNSARGFNRAMQKRKKFIYTSLTKQTAAKQLIDIFDVPAITFSESVDFAKGLNKVTQPWGEAYHSKMSKYARQNVLNSFASPTTDCRVIHTARALDEGFDVKGIEMAIVCSGTSTPRQDLQRTGRAIRFKENKVGMIINLYLKDTQDEKWLKKRQTKTTNVKWVNSISELIRQCNSSLLRNADAAALEQVYADGQRTDMERGTRI
jgi:superfamily II DNA or RNA helicase